MDPVSEAATEAASSASDPESAEARRPNSSCFFFMMSSRSSWELSGSGLLRGSSPGSWEDKEG